MKGAGEKVGWHQAGLLGRLRKLQQSHWEVLVLGQPPKESCVSQNGVLPLQPITGREQASESGVLMQTHQ